MSKLETSSFTGPASYTTGGHTISTGLTQVDFANVEIDTPGANLPHFQVVISRSGANFTYKIMRVQSDQLTTIDAVSGLPAGVSAAASSGQTYDTVSHLHTMAHDHPATTSTTNTSTGGGTTLDLTSPISIGAHTHSFNPPNFTGNTGSEAAHTHTWNNIYQHQHSLTQTETNMTLSEIANGTNLSGATLTYKAVQE